jgi:hypothetical protein
MKRERIIIFTLFAALAWTAAISLSKGFRPARWH